MPKDIRWKLALIAAVAALCGFLIFPAQEQIKLGLDLRGGIHLAMRVQVDEAVIAEIRDDLDVLERLLEDEGVEVVSTQANGIEGSTLIFAGAEGLDRGLELSRERFSTYDTARAGSDPPTLELSLHAADRARIQDGAVRQALQTIRNRIDEYGVNEPVIQRQGLFEDRILVQLPGVENPERVKALLRNTALLELKLVVGSSAPSREALLEPYGGQIPPNQNVVVYGHDDAGGAVHEQYLLVEENPVVTGRDLKTARIAQDEMGLPAVNFSLNPEGTRKFAAATGENIGRQLAIILDRRVHSAPVIEDRISGNGIIRGSFTLEEAEDLALVLRAGALPASIEYLEERTVGPSLGRESIRQGIAAAIVGMALVIVFMLVYYLGTGINAVIALALNLLIVLGVMAFLGATLTLPGIGGLILLIGMAVDANVLVFERIREELDLGKTVRSAVDSGFAKAFSAIVDANVTTLVAAVFLFQFGTGPVKGFAVTLSIGILASMFTAIFVSRVLFSIWIWRRPGALSI